MRILIVRLSALGDIVHTLPVVAALGRAFPDARIDWLVDERFRELIALVPTVGQSIGWPRLDPDGVVGFDRVIGRLRDQRYDLALDVQGLIKSAVAARLSGAGRVIGFEPARLREPAARWFHTDHALVEGSPHVIDKNLALVRHLGAQLGRWEFPLRVQPSAVITETVTRLAPTADERIVVLNPGTAWDSKCWAPSRYAELARQLRRARGVRSVVSWGPSERERAELVVTQSEGAAVMAPPTSLVDLVALLDAAALVVAGDTGPLHLAAAVGTPVVGIYGPSPPSRNGPWAPTDRVVSAPECSCRETQGRSRTHGIVVKQCRQVRRCLDEVSVDDVLTSVVAGLDRSDAHA